MLFNGKIFADSAHGASVRAAAARARSVRPRARLRHVHRRLCDFDWSLNGLYLCGSSILRLVGWYCPRRLADVYKVMCLWGSWSLALLFALLLVPSVSLADTSGSGGGYYGWADMIVDGNTVITEDGYQLQGYVVAASSRYDAACAVLGVDAGSLTPEAETKLSNESTGGQFYAFVQDMEVNEFGNYPAGWAGDTPFLSGLNSVYGVGNVYWIVTGDEAKDGARNDFNTVKNGGSLGGGGGGVVSDSFVCQAIPFSFRTDGKTDIDKRRIYDTFTHDGTFTTRMNGNGTAYSGTLLDDNFVVSLPANSLPNMPDVYSIVNTYYSVGFSGSTFVFNVVLLDSNDMNLSLTPYTTTSDTDVTKTFNELLGTAHAVYSCRVYSTDYALSSTGIQVNTISNVPSWSTENYTFSLSSNNGTVMGFNGHGSSGGGGGSGGGGTNNWPQPTQPNTDPPEVPTPTTPTEPTQPNLDPSDDVTWGTPPQFNPSDTLTPIVTEPTVTIINVTNEPTGTDPTDYTPWLRAILNELKNIHTDLGSLLNGVISAINRVISALNDLNAALTTHCGHIRTAIHNDFNYYVRNIISQMVSDTNTVGTNIRTQVGWLVQSMRDCYSHLEDYLYDLFHWLAEQFDFTFSSVPSYDDRSVLYWLKKIWLRLGTNQYYSPIGPSAPTPTAQDVETGFDWWAWLLSLIDQLFNNVASELVEDVDAFVESLREIWPISVPWDLLGAFVLLGANPETPTWTVTIPSVCGLPSYDYVIDLHPYDGLAATVRNMETVVFAFYLLMKSDWLLDLISKGLQKCTVFFDSLVGT